MSSIGFILGSGWGGIIEDIKNKKEKGFEEIFGKKTTVSGHRGKVISGKLSNKDLIIISGRFHTYEGYGSFEATQTIRYLRAKGVKEVVITSASGGLNPKYSVGDLVILQDVISLFCQSPLAGAKFQNLSQPFSPDLIKKAQQAAVLTGISLQKGVYIYMKGPHYETFADKMALRMLGADIVGMSTVPEVIMANYLGIKVLGLSLVTNLAFVKHDHKDVLAAVENQSRKLSSFFRKLIASF